MFWYDEKAEFTQDIETLVLENAKLYHLEKDKTFYTKHFFEILDKTANYLVYALFPKPDLKDNQLTDMLLYSKEFFADRISLIIVELKINIIPSSE